MWDKCYQIRFLQFFLLSTPNFETALSYEIHKPDLALKFEGDGCDPPWISCGSSNSCYLRGTWEELRGTWEQGLDFCDTHGGYMLEVNSEKEHLDIIGRLKKNLI